MKQNQREAMIAEVMDGFDFEQVHRVMTVLDWKWDIRPNEIVVPSTYRLMKLAEKLLNDVSQYEDKQRHEIATGGLRAICDENEDLELRFEIEDSVSFNGDYDEYGNCIYK